jgi:hypothetical protein
MLFFMSLLLVCGEIQIWVCRAEPVTPEGHIAPEGHISPARHIVPEGHLANSQKG